MYETTFIGTSEQITPMLLAGDPGLMGHEVTGLNPEKHKQINHPLFPILKKQAELHLPSTIHFWFTPMSHQHSNNHLVRTKKDKKTNFLSTPTSLNDDNVVRMNVVDLPSIKVLEEDVALLGLLAPVTDDTARAVDDLAGVALTVKDACGCKCRRLVAGALTCACVWERRTEASPLSELLSVGDLDEGDLVLGAESLDKLLVGVLVAVLVQDAHMGLATVESLRSFAESTGQPIVNEGVAENSLESILHGHLALGGRVRRYLNFLGGLDRGNLRSESSVRYSPDGNEGAGGVGGGPVWRW